MTAILPPCSTSIVGAISCQTGPHRVNRRQSITDGLIDIETDRTVTTFCSFNPRELLLTPVSAIFRSYDRYSIHSTVDARINVILSPSGFIVSDLS